MWQFDSEQHLEAFVYAHLLHLLNLTPLAQQFSLDSQVCDILAINPQQQLVILELKITEDHHIVQQLTRYYSAILRHKPYASQVDYSLPIRLVAIAPSFHTHSFTDCQYSQLQFEFCTFQVQPQDERLQFYLTPLGSRSVSSITIPTAFYPTLINTTLPAKLEVENKLPLLPKSLRRLSESLAPGEQEYLLQLRQQILIFSDQMQEVGRTTSTQYGLRKGENNLYKTKVCAQFIPFYAGSDLPRLLLRLPYPKKEFGDPGRRYKPERVKGLTWGQVSHQQQLWDSTQPIQIFFYFGTTLNRYSYVYDLNTYAQVCSKLMEKECKLRSLADLVTITLEEWQQAVMPQVD